MSINNATTWVGVGAKAAASLGPGAEETFGVVWNMNDFRSHSYLIQSLRVGFGIGGGVNAALLFVFNANNIWSANYRPITDWGIQISLGARWGDLLRGALNTERYASVMRLFANMQNAASARRMAVSAGDLEQLRDLTNAIQSGTDAYNQSFSSNEIQIAAIDVPMSGVGMELSANYVTGKLLIL